MNYRIAALSAAFVASCASDPELQEESPPPEIEGVQQPFWTAAAGTHDHGDITEDVLSFLLVKGNLADQNEAVDSDDGPTKLLSEYHNDDCKIGGAFEVVRRRHRAALAALNPRAFDKDQAVHEFGRLLHTVQDFYAHSNWVEAHESGMVGTPSDILARGSFTYPSAEPGSIIGGMALMAEPVPASWRYSRPTGSRVPRVTTEMGAAPGLMTGTYTANVGVDICPDSVQIPHGDPFPNVDVNAVEFNSVSVSAGASYTSYLAKDNPRSSYHDQAVSRAKVQTLEEFCRLGRNVLLAYGQAGVATLVAYWYPYFIAPGVYPLTVETLERNCPNTRAKVAALLTTVL